MGNYSENHWQGKEDPEFFPVMKGQRLLSTLCDNEKVWLADTEAGWSLECYELEYPTFETLYIVLSPSCS